MPAARPVRPPPVVLEEDMGRLNITTQYEYVRWLLGQRYRHLTSGSMGRAR